MSLLHDFGLLHQSDIAYTDLRRLTYGDQRNRWEQHVTLHDDLVRYLGDSLLWIPTYNPSRQVDQVGLNLHGVTVIAKPGAAIAAGVFLNWADLFSFSGSELVLTGSYGWNPGQTPLESLAENPGSSSDATVTAPRTPGSGCYEQLRFQRDEIVAALRALGAACKQVAGGDGDGYILHLGI